MTPVPQVGTIDSSLALLRDGYEFIQKRCREHSTDVFETRLAGQTAVCMSGPEAAREFYVPERMTRQGALPPTVLTLLQDKGSVATLDGAEHHARKQIFLSLTRPGHFDKLLDYSAAEWMSAAERWQRRSSVVLHEAVQEILTRAVVSWAGLPLGEDEVASRAAELAAMIDGAGSAGPRQVRGQVLRQRHERWVQDAMKAAPPDSPAGVIARELSDPAVAAVEIINLLRPTVAVARFIMFSALALHEYPDAPVEPHEQFVQEVRRFYPFFPLVAGRVLEPFAWRGYEFPEHRWVMLDIYGTNRDARAWQEPERFDPARFAGWAGDPFTLIPQGGGDHELNHRCPGEWITIELMKQALAFLTERIDYEVPEQDLSVSLSRMPTGPASGFVIQNVRLRGS